MNDFDSIVDALEIFDLERERLAVLKDIFVNFPIIYKLFQGWDEAYERHKVFILTSYLEAHNYSQKILAKYLGERGFVDTPEEGLIIKVSQYVFYLEPAVTITPYSILYTAVVIFYILWCTRKP